MAASSMNVGNASSSSSASSFRAGNAATAAGAFASQPLYEEISVIGTGAYGTVYKGYDVKTSKIVAMKRIRIQLTEEGLPISTVREISYLRQLEKHDHPNIVRLFDVCHGPRLQSEQSIILIFEYVDYDLDNYLKSYALGLGLPKIMDIMRQMLTGVDFLHVNRIIHRDLKPQNILVTKDGQVKIADFGLARIYGFSMALTSVVVTLWYRSPEVLLHSTYSASVDMWSLGCIFAELYMRRPLFMGLSDVDQLFKIFDILGLPAEADWPVNSVIPLKSFTNANANLARAHANADANLRTLLPNMDERALDLLRRLLDFNLNNRITAHEALAHSYFEACLGASDGSANAAAAGATRPGDMSSSISNLNENMNEINLNQGVESTGGASEPRLGSLPDITNLFQPNILKRKRNVGGEAK